MEQCRQENVWMVCLNCEFQYNMDEALTEDYASGCPLCGSRSYRACEQDDLYSDDIMHYDRKDFGDDFI